jgi:hypothetical protein
MKFSYELVNNEMLPGLPGKNSLNADLKQPKVIVLVNSHWKTFHLQTLAFNKLLLFYIVLDLCSQLFRKWVKFEWSCVFKWIIMNRYKSNKNGLVVNFIEIPNSESENCKNYNIS